MFNPIEFDQQVIYSISDDFQSATRCLKHSHLRNYDVFETKVRKDKKDIADGGYVSPCHVMSPTSHRRATVNY